MKKLKRILSSILALTLVLPIIACAKEGGGSSYQKPHSWSDGNTVITGTCYDPEYTRDDIPEAIARASISADSVIGNLCATDTSFTVRPSGNTSAAEILAHITSSPNIDFICTETENGTYTLTPREELEPNTIYRLSVGGEKPISSFAFQTESIFTLDSVFPADLATNVPIDCGIELRFTEAISTPTEDLGDYITVTPKVDGEFLLYPDRKTVVFAPNDRLTTGTVYTVTVSSGLMGEGEALGESFTHKFRTSPTEIDESSVKCTFNLYNSMPVFAPDDAMYLSYNVSYYTDFKTDPTHREAVVKIYRYASAEDAVDAMKDYLSSAVEYAYSGKNYSYPTRGLSLVSESRVTPTAQSSRYYATQYLDLPTLDCGIYLICVTPSVSIGGINISGELQALVQVSDYAVYTESSADTLVWVNSVSGADTSGLPIKAEIFRANDGWDTENTGSVYKTIEAVTDRDGIAILDTSAMNEANRAFITVDNSLIICASGLNQNTTSTKYLAWIYTDRETYLSSDTVNFSGVVSPLDGGSSLPEYIYLTTSLSTAKEKIKLNSDGSFTGSFSYEDYAAGYRSMIYLSFTDPDGNTVDYAYIYVSAKDKPVYTASIEFDRLFYEFGDRGVATLTASFFDGTPAPGLSFSVYLSPFGGTKSVTTDENGVAKIEFTCTRRTIESTYPSTISESAHLIGYEDTSLETYTTAVYFHSDRHLRAERDEDGCGITVRLNMFDTSVIETAEDLSWNVFPENCIGDAADGKITVTLKKITYYRTESGSQYNPITKKTEKTYRYTSSESNVSTKTYEFENGEIHLPCLDREDDCSYYYVITYYDAQNACDVRMTVGAVKYSSSYHYSYSDSYSLEYAADSNEKLKSGDSAEYLLKYGGKTVSDKKVLHSVYTAVENGRSYHEITNGGFSVEYTKDYIFGVRIIAAVFDGRSVKTLWVNAPQYDTETENSLDITLSPSGESFKPGDECIVNIKATLPDGSDAAGSVITVAVVDEALFALGEQNLDPLNEYFSAYVSSPSTNSRFNCFGYYYRLYTNGDDIKFESATEADAESPGESADDSTAFDSVTVREYFANCPVFESVTLDKNGEASIIFTVPDNITSWRITAAGYRLESDAAETKLGYTKSDVIATLPFFVSASLSDTYVLGDDISATARIFGAGTLSGESVSYLAELSDYDGNVLRELEAEAKIGEQTHFNLGKLDVGTYYLTVKAIAGEMSDGVRLPFNVVPDGITMSSRRVLRADEISSLNPTLYPVNISFTNAEFSDYLDVLFYVSSTRYNRADSLAARYAALSAIDKIYGGGLESKELDEIKNTLASYNHRGLIPLMEYAEGDVILSAKIAALTPELIPSGRRGEMADVFREMILEQSYTSDVQLAACLLGLASLGEPVLGDIYAVASSDISVEAQLYLSLALCVIGDYSAAHELYSLVTDGKFEGDDEICITAETVEEKIRLTALALMTASYVDTGRAEKMAKYIISRNSSLDVYTLELVAYINNFYPIGATEAKFTYEIEGSEAVEVTLRPGEVFTLTLGKSALKSLEVDAGDDVLILASYLCGATEALSGYGIDEDAKITKTIEPHDLSRGLYKVTISYEITFDSSYECYTLSDRIPSGARYYGAYEEHANKSSTDNYSFAYLRNDGDQMMTGYIGMYNPTEKYMDGTSPRTVRGEITYLIRAAVSGEFTVSSAILQNMDSGKFALSENGCIVIGEAKNDKWKIELQK